MTSERGPIARKNRANGTFLDLGTATFTSHVEDDSNASFVPSRPITRRRRILLEVSNDDNSPPKKLRGSPPTERSPANNVLQDTSQSKHENDEDEIHDDSEVTSQGHRVKAIVTVRRYKLKSTFRIPCRFQSLMFTTHHQTIKVTCPTRPRAQLCLHTPRLKMGCQLRNATSSCPMWAIIRLGTAW